MTAHEIIGAQGWSETRERAAKWFVADVAKRARMLTRPEDLTVDINISESGQVSVTATSKLYYAFGCCFIGPRGGINFRNDHRSLN